jgi:hypothetical protein
MTNPTKIRRQYEVLAAQHDAGWANSTKRALVLSSCLEIIAERFGYVANELFGTSVDMADVYWARQDDAEFRAQRLVSGCTR